MVAEPARRLFTVAEYYQMGSAGILTEDDRVELIEGEIIEMPPIGGRHASCVDRITELFVSALEDQPRFALKIRYASTCTQNHSPTSCSCGPVQTSTPSDTRFQRMSCCSSRCPTPRSLTTGA